MEMVHFKNPKGINNDTAFGVGSLGYMHIPQERFCMLGWHWVFDFRDDVIQTILENPFGSDIPIQACQVCMRRWHAKGRVHIGTLTNEAVFWPGDFRPHHERMIKGYLRSRAPLLRDEPTRTTPDGLPCNRRDNRWTDATK